MGYGLMLDQLCKRLIVLLCNFFLFCICIFADNIDLIFQQQVVGVDHEIYANIYPDADPMGIFLDNDILVYTKRRKEIRFYNINTKKSEIVFESKNIIFLIGEISDNVIFKIMDRNNNRNIGYYRLNKSKIIEPCKEIKLNKNIIFDINERKLRITRNKYKKEISDIYLTPVYNEFEEALYYLTNEDNSSSVTTFSLMKYSISENKVYLIQKGVRSFSLNNRYLIICDLNSKSQISIIYTEVIYHLEIIDLKNGIILLNSDEMIAKGKQFAIEYLSLNSKDILSIFGTYFYKENGKLYKKRPLFLMKIIEDNNVSNKKQFTTKIDNLRFRERPDLDSKVIRVFKKSEKLTILETGKTETIDGVKGTWVKVKTEQGEIGWCFDAYLEEVK